MDTKDFVRRHKITMQAEMVDRNPNTPDWTDADHWKCRLRMGGRSLTTYFSMGFALAREPRPEDVLDCLASDATGPDQQSFEEWCSEYGYDTDSRKAERTYQTIQKQSDKLKRFLGELDYEFLLYSTERL